MARYTGPACRLCRRQGTKLFLKGAKCSTEKCPFNKRGFAPGQHGQNRVKLSDYGLQLREKQKVKRMYGVLERQFRKNFQAASRAKGVTGERLLEGMELRLDNVVYRLGFAASRAQARQLVCYGHVRVGGGRIDIPSYQVRPGQVVGMAGSEKFMKWLKEVTESTKERPVPPWLSRRPEEPQGTVVARPKREDVGFPITEQLIVELYSR